ncbi:MAG: hypothetical protein A2622_00370 [Bdellovibrionales bacterium RIFCSPHIGHO2_01_FULL_40_29]|nr:MAG: hypothetical protein A2622_00370 [Bdellovibrionales bacterium RIFCSPHIGHO2_01_FULL_40_29]OFZ32579.1 MAG: hypothetical protein A3D17_04970 [Bdellovibrionales bacterium RIFCSPHIGHO2_02_FULL_40_15]
MTTKTQDIMSINLVTVNMHDALDDAYTTMRSNNIRHMPVVNKFGDVVGIISDRDFQRAMNSDTPESIDFGYKAIVRDFMSTPVITVPYDAELISVVQKMIDEKVSSFLVTSENTIVGIVSHEDLLKVLADMLYPTKDGVIASVTTWLSKTPIGDIARSLSGAGI